MLRSPKIRFLISAWLLCDVNTHYSLSWVLKLFHTSTSVCKGEQTSHLPRNLRESLEPPVVIITPHFNYSDLL